MTRLIILFIFQDLQLAISGSVVMVYCAPVSYTRLSPCLCDAEMDVDKRPTTKRKRSCSLHGHGCIYVACAKTIRDIFSGEEAAAQLHSATKEFT